MAQYILKDALVAEIEKKKVPYKKDINDGVYPTYLCALMDIEDFLDTLEVKEVDLEKEIDKWWWGRTWQTYGMMLNSYNIMDFAKHFFELGLKAQKGE